MKTSELRLGNFVQYQNKCNTLILRVTRIFEKRLTVKYNTSGPSPIDIKDVSGIPLTPETVQICGFQEVGIYENVFHRGDYRIILDQKKSTGLLKYETDDFHIEVEVKSVHQLQNVYCALTGEELSVSFET